MRHLTVAIGAMLIASGIANAHDEFPLQYRVEKLEGIGGTTSHINDRGSVTGYGFDSAGQAISFLWTRTRLIDLRSDPDVRVIDALDVNNRQEVVGTASITNPDGTHATNGYVWRRGKFELIGDLPGGIAVSVAQAINERGQVFGTGNSDQGTECVLWEDGVLMALPGFPPRPDCTALGMNDFGTLVGAFGGGPRAKPFVWRHGLMRELPLPDDAVAGSAGAINNFGVIIGGYRRADGSGEPVLWRGGRLRHLPVPPPYISAFAGSINDRGVVAGSAALDTLGTSVAVVWVKGRLIDVNTLIAPDDPLKPCVVLRTADGINERGEIAATGVDACVDLSSTAFRLVPKRRRQGHWH